MVANSGQSDWNDIIEPGGSGTSERGSLPSRRAVRVAAGSHASRKAAKASSAGKKGLAKKKHWWVKRIGYSVLTVFLGVLIAGMTVFLYPYNTLTVPAPDDLALAQKTTVYYTGGTAEIGTLGGINCQIIGTTMLPDYVSKSIVASEDRTFYTNLGVDLRGIFRALINNLRGSARQGGSTLTQQYVERCYIGETISYTGRLKETVLAIKINREKSEDKAIGAYMDTIYFGRGTYGIDAVARAYFGHGAFQLALSESALLVAVIPASSARDPAVNPDKAKERWERDLNLMVENGWVTQADKDAAAFPETIDPGTLNSATMTGTNGYLMAQVKQELLAPDQFDEDKISQGGLRVTSTIVKEHQEQAVVAAEGMSGVEGWDLTHRRVVPSSMDPVTGKVFAEYAGADYEKRQQNAVAQGITMAGSASKPFVLLANAHLGGMVYDTYSGRSPQYFRGMGTPVSNDGGYPFGNVTLVKATTYSMNAVFVGLNDGVEPENTLKAAIDAGIPEDTVDLNDELLSALGPFSLHNIDLTTAYSTITNGGERVTAHIVKKVKDSNGKLLYSGDAAPKRVFDVKEVSSIMPALEAVTKGEGTAASVDPAVA